MAEALVGKWNFLSGDNVDAYMDALGVSEQLRELARNIKPTIEISKDGDTWTIKTIAGDKTAETKFTGEQEVDTVSLIGQQVKAKLKIDGNKMIETQKVGDLEIVIERTVIDGIYTAKMRTKGVEAVLQFIKA
ncbi:unnamed protein product [Candidula unifasciata]|uniref:Uncharacterized protein n=1 Tax=Candidula unifasciata TaxID=100452 RepID=A0A8S4A1S3_9EUPU|nr:unnamed protein product [Candidula unifasciata]